MGGYFAPALGALCAALPGRIAGVVEDTENGLRRYEALSELPCAVYSVARSPRKEPEAAYAVLGSRLRWSQGLDSAPSVPEYYDRIMNIAFGNHPNGSEG